MDAADLSPVPEAQRTQSPVDLFLIFAAANVVATTMQTGAALGLRYGASGAIGDRAGRRHLRGAAGGDPRPGRIA